MPLGDGHHHRALVQQVPASWAAVERTAKDGVAITTRLAALYRTAEVGGQFQPVGQMVPPSADRFSRFSRSSLHSSSW